MESRDELFGKGLGLYGQRKYDEAVDALTGAVAADPKFADAYLALGHALQKLGRLPEAAEALQKAIAIDGQEPLYHTSLSTVYRDMGRISDAEEHMAISFELQRGR
jgi:tetratricopeptide (TPR) repeat protein